MQAHRDFVLNEVAHLYASHQRLDNPAFYGKGGLNPFKGLCDIIPAKARYYAMVPLDDENNVTLAKTMMKRMAGRRKLREVVKDRKEVFYPGFVKGSDILVLWA